MINRERLIREFHTLAAIESPSHREGELSTYLHRKFTEMGGAVFEDQSQSLTGSESGNLIIHFPGTGEPLMLAVHMDTVEPAVGVDPVLREGVFFSRGETILGADDKAGLVEIIEAMLVMQEQKVEHCPIDIVLTVCEEVGLVGAKNLDYSRVRARQGLALDATGVDLIINQAPSANRFIVTVTGVEAHAGIAPEKGLSAIQVAATAVSKLQLGRIDEQTTANIGKIEGGQATNIIPKQVVLHGEVRSHNHSRLADVTEEIHQAFLSAAEECKMVINGRDTKAGILFDMWEEYPSLSVAGDSSIVRRVEKAAKVIGSSITVRAAGGGSDASIYNKNGIETVIMGVGMNNVHSVDEFVRVDDMVSVTAHLVEILRVQE